MIDTILYVAVFPALVAELDTNYPDMLARNNDESIAMPPVVIGFARTPAAQNGDSVLVYARLTETDAAQYRSIQQMEVLAETEYTGKGTADRLYQIVFDDPEKLAKYDSVHQRVRVVTDPETGEEQQVRQDKFGILAGA